MTIDKGIREKIMEASSIGVEYVNFPYLPISYKNMKEKRRIHFILAHCPRCRRVTNHLIYPGNYGINVKCHVCGECGGWDSCYLGRIIYSFVKMYCPSCNVVNVHAIYEDDIGELYIRCLGCGRKIYVGRSK